MGDGADRYVDPLVDPPSEKLLQTHQPPVDSCDETEKQRQLQRLKHENDCLRLQLLKLREQHQSLNSGGTSPIGASSLSKVGGSPAAKVTRGSPQEVAIATASVEATQPLDAASEEATALRARILQRRDGRCQRATAVRSLLLDVDHTDTSECTVSRQEMEAASKSDGIVAVDAASSSLLMASTPVPISPRVSDPVDAASARVPTLQQAYEEMVLRQTRLASPSAESSVSALLSSTLASATLSCSTRRGGTGQDDSSAEAMLHRIQGRRTQRRLRMERMRGSGLDSVGDEPDRDSPATPPLGKPSCGSAMPLVEPEPANPLGKGGVVEECGIGRGARPCRICRRPESANVTAATAAPVRTVQNPNQIGRVVSDASKNNSWYLCKVLEAALLDTILARPAGEASRDSPPPPQGLPPPSTPHGRKVSFSENLLSSSSSETSPSSLYQVCAEHGVTGGFQRTSTPTTRSTSVTPLPEVPTTSPASAKVPQLLYREGVTDTALRRAIDESLFLPFRCMQDAPRRLTASQAADETVPPFENENRDLELRRCFAEGDGRVAAMEDSSHTGAAEEEEFPDREVDMLGANDQNLDPFARLLLAQLSPNLPTSTGKQDPKSAKQQHGTGKNGAAILSQASSVSSPSSTAPPYSRAGVALTVAAAGSDRRVHVPKKHFSRLDEVQVEMHAPVIFNQIRGFLHLDTERFRRSFRPPSAPAAESGPLSKPEDGTPESRRQLAAQTQQRRLRVGATAGSNEATTWRISVSPGKSGTTLLYFGDYVMKTVRPSELEFLLRKFLPSYVRYSERNPHTLLPRFYALATLRWWKAGIVQHFVLMQNVFATPYYINRIYDVKGSTVNRTALQPGKEPPRTAFGALLLKDNDLPSHLIICGRYQRAILLAQFRSDVGFLRQLNVVDYSCMIGVRSRLFSREEGPSKTILILRKQPKSTSVDSLLPGASAERLLNSMSSGGDVRYVTGETVSAGAQGIDVGTDGSALPPAPGDEKRAGATSEDDVYVCIHGCDGGLLSLPIYTPGDDTTAREDVYYIGIIDVLQTYNSAKKIESFAKGLVNDRRAISVIPPEGYAERLYQAIERIAV